MVKYLLEECGEGVNGREDSDCSGGVTCDSPSLKRIRRIPLIAAVQARNHEIAEYLINNKADVNRKGKLFIMFVCLLIYIC